MNKEKRGILIGLILGDGYLSKPDKWNSVSIEIEHTESQKSYIEYKYDLTMKILGGKKVKLHKRIRNRKSSNLISYRFRKGHKYLRLLRNKIYPKGKKVLSKEVLNYLTDFGVALWVMDDGTCSLKKNKEGKIKSCQFKLCLCLPNIKECEDVCSFFKERYDSNFKIVKHMKSKEGQQLYSILANTTEYRKVANKIKKYFIEDMKYKVPEVLFPRVLDNLEKVEDIC